MQASPSLRTQSLPQNQVEDIWHIDERRGSGSTRYRCCCLGLLRNTGYPNAGTGHPVWRPVHLNTLLQLVIKDELANVLLVADDCSWVFYPYQGGMDVIFGSVEHRDEFAQRHAAWIPASADRL